MPQDNVPARVWNYRLDTEGKLWHEGSVFDDPDILKFFMRKMELLPDGRCFALCQGEECYFEAEDTVYVVQSVQILPDRVVLHFQGDYQEDLDPKTLYVGKDNVLYCQVRGGSFAARFNRKPYLELAQLIEYDAEAKRYFLALTGQRFVISGI